jgi:hypothetical protein
MRLIPMATLGHTVEELPKLPSSYNKSQRAYYLKNKEKVATANRARYLARCAAEGREPRKSGGRPKKLVVPSELVEDLPALED